METIPTGGGRRWIIPLAVLLAGLAVFGAVTWLLGLGPFAYRQILYGSSEVYLLNMSARTVWVTLDRGKAIKIVAEGAERTPLLGGTTHVTTRDASGELIEELNLETDGHPVLYSVEGDKCLVLADVSSFYLGDKPSEQGVRVVETYPRGTRLVSLPSDRVIWPRKTLTDKVRDAEKGVYWVDMVACPLLDSEESAVLEAHLNILLTERKKREQDLALRRKMLLEGSGAVDEAVGVKAARPAKAAVAADAGLPREGDVANEP